MKYRNLTKMQIDELCAMMDRLIQYGQVIFEPRETCECKNGLQVRLIRRPDKRMVDEAYFDYAEFYEKYDQMTWELQKVFNTIIAGARFPDASEQILTLQPQRKLVYKRVDGGAVNFSFLKKIEGTPHVQHLMDSVNEQIFDLTAKDVRIMCRERPIFPDGPLRCYDGRMEIDVELDETGTNAPVAQQLQIERVIRYLKRHRTQYFANKILGQVLKEILGAADRKVFFEYVPQSWKMHLENAMIVPLNGYVINQLATAMNCEMSKFRVNLAKVDDKEFISRVQAEVYRMSCGLIKVDIVNKTYRTCWGE